MDLVFIAEHFLIFIAIVILILSLSFFSDKVYNSQSRQYDFPILTLILIVGIYAVVKTGGITVLLLLIPLILFYYSQKNRPTKIQSKHKLSFGFKSNLGLGVIGCLFFFVQVYSYFENYQIVDSFYVDYLFYAREAAYLRDYGVENTIIENFLPVDQGVVPYHYLELWFAALTSDLFSIKILPALILIVYPTFYFLTLYVLRRVLFKLNAKNENFKNNIFYYLLITLFFILGQPDFSFLIDSEVTRLPSWFFTILGHHKGSIVLLFSILILNQFMDKNYLKVSLLVAMMVLCDVSSLFSLLGGVGMFFLYKTIKKDFKLIEFFKYLTPLILVSLYFLLFYSLAGSKNNVALNLNEFLLQFDTAEEMRRIVNIIGKSIIQTSISLLVFILVSLRYKKLRKKFGDFFVLSFFIYIFGLLAWALLNQMQDSVQFFVNANNFFIILSIFVIINYALNKIENKKLRIFVLSSFILFFGSQYVYKYGNKINLIPLSSFHIDELKLDTDSPRFAYLKEGHDYQNKASQYEQIYTGQLNSLIYQYDPLKIACLSINEIPIESENDKKYYDLLTFKKYIETQNSGISTDNYHELQQKFVVDYNITHLLVNKNRAVPREFIKLFDNEKVGMVDGYSIYKRKP